MNHRGLDSCPSEENLLAYVDGEVESEACTRLARHLERCARCRSEVEELERVSRGLRRLFRVASEEIKVPETVSGLRLVGGSRRRWLMGVAAAAAVLAVLTLTWRFLSTVPEVPVSSSEPQSVAEISESGSEGEAVETVFAQSDAPLRVDTLALALAGDVDAQIQLCRQGLDGDFLRADKKRVWPGAPIPTIGEVEVRRQRLAALAQRIMGGER